MKKLPFAPLVCLASLAAAGLAAGCAVKPPGITSGNTGGGSTGASTGGAVAPAAPVLQPGIPSSTPEPSVAIGGTAQGAIGVVITGGAEPVEVETLGTSSTFCANVPLVPGTNNFLEITALSGLGPISSSVPWTVTQNPSAAPVDPFLCNGEDPPLDAGSAISCSDAYEGLCMNACNHCPLDGYEPNATQAEAPELTGNEQPDGGGQFPAVYAPLELCPCNDEWFSIVAPAGAKIDVEIVPSKPNTSIGLQLYRPVDWVPDGGGNPLIASAVTNIGDAGDVARIQWFADDTSLYDVRVFGQADASVPYTMVLQNFTVPFPVDAGVDAGLPTGPVDAGPGIGSVCHATGPGADPTECNPNTPYCDINESPHSCVSSPADTVGQSCNLAVASPDAQCNFGIGGTQIVCGDVGGVGECVQGYCNNNVDCPAGDSCSANRCAP